MKHHGSQHHQEGNGDAPVEPTSRSLVRRHPAGLERTGRLDLAGDELVLAPGRSEMGVPGWFLGRLQEDRGSVEPITFYRTKLAAVRDLPEVAFSHGFAPAADPVPSITLIGADAVDYAEEKGMLLNLRDGATGPGIPIEKARGFAQVDPCLVWVSVPASPRREPVTPAETVGPAPGEAAAAAPATGGFKRPAIIGHLSAPTNLVPAGRPDLRVLCHEGRTLVFADTETGGLPRQPGEQVGDFALLSVSLVVPLDGDDRAVLAREWKVLPFPGARITPEAVAKNGYSPERWEAEGAQHEDEVLRQMAYFLHSIRGPEWVQFVAHGATYDRAVLDAAHRRVVGEDCRPEAWGCTLTGVDLLKEAKVYQGSRSLGAIYEHAFGEKLVNAHQALADTVAAVRLARWIWAAQQRIPLV